MIICATILSTILERKSTNVKRLMFAGVILQRPEDRRAQLARNGLPRDHDEDRVPLFGLHI